jgi:hypothetical protein
LDKWWGELFMGETETLNSLKTYLGCEWMWCVEVLKHIEASLVLSHNFHKHQDSATWVEYGGISGNNEHSGGQFLMKLHRLVCLIHVACWSWENPGQWSSFMFSSHTGITGNIGSWPVENSCYWQLLVT